MSKNALDTTNILAKRKTSSDRDQVQCPHCGTWRPGFCITELDAVTALLRGTAWACDGDISKWAREI